MSLDDNAVRVEAVEALLVEKGLVDPDLVDEIVEHYETNVGPLNGAKVVARAWTDPAYRQRLLADGTSAIAELGYGGPEAAKLIVVENTSDVHNVVVCTLCSCYPWPVLGLPPRWYKSDGVPLAHGRPAARGAGRDGPRRPGRRARPGVGQLGGGALPRSAGASSGARTTSGPEELVALVSRDSMIGVGRPLAPDAAG